MYFLYDFYKHERMSVFNLCTFEFDYFISMSNKQIAGHFSEAQKVLKEFSENQRNIKAIANAGDLMVRAIQSGGKLISCGNGGSMCDAMHFAEELTGKFREDRSPLPAIAISDPSYLSCTANDYGFDKSFARFVDGFGAYNDVLLAISTSGNSKNVILAAETAVRKNMQVVALTGKDGGRLTDLADVEIRAPHSSFADRAQEIHIKVIHALIDYIETCLDM